jgi:hypothetical protein
MEKDEMTMEESCKYQIDRYLYDAESEFDRIFAEDGRRRRNVRRWALLGITCAAAIALLFWLVPATPSSGDLMTPVQIAEGIQQMMLLDIGDIEFIEAVPKDSYALLTAHLKDGSTCSYILKCNDAEGTTTLLAYNKKQLKK